MLAIDRKSKGNRRALMKGNYRKVRTTCINDFREGREGTWKPLRRSLRPLHLGSVKADSLQVGYPYNTPPKPWGKGGVIGVVCCKGRKIDFWGALRVGKAVAMCRRNVPVIYFIKHRLQAP